MLLLVPEDAPDEHCHHTHHDPRKDPDYKLSHTNPSLSFCFPCLTAHESSEIISAKSPVLPALHKETLRCLISAVKLFYWLFCLSFRPVPVPDLPQRFLGGGTRMPCRIKSAAHTYAYSSPVSSRKAGYSVFKVQRKKYVSFH